MTSTNGLSWVNVTGTDTFTGCWNSVCWSEELGLFVVVGQSGANQVLTSTDGLNWYGQKTATSGTVIPWNSVCWGAEVGLFTAVAPTGAFQIMTSPDGITWTGRTGGGNQTWSGICFSPGLTLFAAFANTGTNKIMTNPN
jgi:hypothetical protein